MMDGWMVVESELAQLEVVVVHGFVIEGLVIERCFVVLVARDWMIF